MRSFDYTFSTRIEYSQAPSTQDFLLRAIAINGHFQRLHNAKLEVVSCDNLAFQYDAFGNWVQVGRISKAQNFFEFRSTACVFQTKYAIFENYNPIYLYPTNLTKANDAILDFFLSLDLKDSQDNLIKAKKICDAVFNLMTYTKSVTNSATTAQEAFAQKAGVCQDYVQIAIALCRLAKIPARYVNGLIAGDGESHAWIEIWDNYRWYAFDPTNDLQVEYGYIKISNGRDARDCALNKGIISCIAQQSIVSSVSVYENFA